MPPAIARQMLLLLPCICTLFASVKELMLLQDSTTIKIDTDTRLAMMIAANSVRNSITASTTLSSTIPLQGTVKTAGGGGSVVIRRLVKSSQPEKRNRGDQRWLQLSLRT